MRGKARRVRNAIVLRHPQTSPRIIWETSQIGLLSLFCDSAPRWSSFIHENDECGVCVVLRFGYLCAILAGCTWSKPAIDGGAVRRCRTGQSDRRFRQRGCSIPLSYLHGGTLARRSTSVPPNNRATICGRRDSRPRAGRFRLVIGINGRVETVEPVRPRNDAVTRCLLTLFAELRFDRRDSRTSITLIVATRNNTRRAEDLGALGTLVEQPAGPGYASIRDHRPRPVFDRFRVRGVLNTRLVEASLRSARFECRFTEIEVALVVRDGRVASIRSNGNECVTRTIEQLRFENTPVPLKLSFD